MRLAPGRSIYPKMIGGTSLRPDSNGTHNQRNQNKDMIARKFNKMNPVDRQKQYTLYRSSHTIDYIKDTEVHEDLELRE